jgi:hypothetical protein
MIHSNFLTVRASHAFRTDPTPFTTCSKNDEKPISIGLIGHGFMGRTHSNAYSQLSHFFDTEHVPVRQAVCGREREKVAAFAEYWAMILIRAT